MFQSPRRVVIAALLLGLFVPSIALACMWDYDTIKMERSRFPGTLELITGKFLRHTPEFYRWRIQDRVNRLESDPTNAALLDDLAVAYDKIGQHDEAIETALRTERLHPGRYETAANLGTFYIHAEKVGEGVVHIDRALKINPDAHFGREKYQKLLAEYVLHRRQDGPHELPLADITIYPNTVRESPSDHHATVQDTFAEFLRSDPYEPLTPDEASAAMKGVLGMMRFGKHDSPILLETLGTLLVQDGHNPTADAKLLAARAFLKASYEVSDEPARLRYRAMAAQAIQMQTPRRDQMSQASLEQVEADFQRELGEARAWYAELRDRELSWIGEAENPEAEFNRLYDADPEVSGMELSDPMSADQRLQRLIVVGGSVLVLIVVGGLAGAIFIAFRVWGVIRSQKTA